MSEVRVIRADFTFTCPGCGTPLGEDDYVYSLPLSIGRWPVCWLCGIEWCVDNGVADPGLPVRKT